MDKYLFGNKLYKLRTEKNLTQKELAKILDVSDKAVSKWETGESMPRVKKLQMIAEFFSVSYEDLLSDNVTETAPQPENNDSYKKAYDKRIKKEFNNLKTIFVGLCLAFLFILLSNFLSPLSALSNGIAINSLSKNIIFTVLPLSLFFGVILFSFPFLKKFPTPSKKQYASVYIPLTFFAILNIVRIFIAKEPNKLFGISFIISTILLGASFIFILKKPASELIQTLGNKLPFISCVLSYIFLAVSSIADFSIILFFEYLALCGGIEYIHSIHKTDRLINILNKVDESEQERKHSTKKLIKWGLVAFGGLFALLSIVFTLIPGIALKLKLSSYETANFQNIEFYEDYDNKFTDEETITLDYEDIKLTIPAKYKLHDKTEMSEFYKLNDQAVLSTQKYEKEKASVSNQEYYTFERNDDFDEDAKLMFLKGLGTYPNNRYDYLSLLYTLQADDISVLNYAQCICYTILLTAREISTMNGSYNIILYNHEGVYAEIIYWERPDESNMYSVALFFDTPTKYDYDFVFSTKEEPVDTLFKILNSVEIKQTI